MTTNGNQPKTITEKQRLAIALEIERRGARRQPATVEVEKGQENNPEHLKKLAEIKERAGWKGGGPYVIEVILNHDRG